MKASGADIASGIVKLVGTQNLKLSAKPALQEQQVFNCLIYMSRNVIKIIAYKAGSGSGIL